jgi:hypothetical protein
MKKKTPQDADLKKILRSSKQLSRLDDSSINAISTAILDSEIIVPKPADEIDSAELTGGVVELSKFDIVLLALVSNPKQWFLVLSGDKRRQNMSGIYQFGGCFEMIRKNENGKINHYARYNGKPMNEAGKRRMESLRKKVEKLGDAAKKNGVIKIHDATPKFKKNKLATPKQAITHYSKKTRKISAKKKTSKISLEHAKTYPLNEEERAFLHFLSLTPRIEYLVSSASKKQNAWFTFRWKWQNRYGFDMSQIVIRQEKQADGMYSTYMTYTPNAANMMNPGLKNLVDFLGSKRQKNKSPIHQITENQVS